LWYNLDIEKDDVFSNYLQTKDVCNWYGIPLLTHAQYFVKSFKNLYLNLYVNCLQSKVAHHLMAKIRYFRN